MDALTAGNDLELAWSTSYRYIPELVREGRISEEAVEKAVKRALLLKARAGLLEENPVFCADGPLDTDSPDNRRLAYEIASRSVVLLKNEGVLPLAGTEKIALVGPNANSVWSMLGDYTFPSMQLFFHRREPDLSAVRIRVGPASSAMSAAATGARWRTYASPPAETPASRECGCAASNPPTRPTATPP